MNQRLETLLHFLEEEPEDAFTLYAIGLEYVNIDVNISKLYFEKLWQLHPGYLGVYYQLGIVWQQLGNKEKAENIYKAGITEALKANDTHTLAELRNALNNMVLGLDDED